MLKTSNCFQKLKETPQCFPIETSLTFRLRSGVVYEYTCGRSNSLYNGEMDRLLKVRSGEHTAILPLTFRGVKPSKESIIHNHLLNCNNIPCFDEFTVLTYRLHQYILELKEGLLIKHDRLALNKNISSTKLFLCHNKR